jgi:alkyl hydroperoxide reductase subunit AhpF
LAQDLSHGTIKETLETRVMEKAEVIVVRSGPVGHKAAIAAARNGARTKLLERYGYPDDMANGGIVIRIANMSDGGKGPVIDGLTLE